MVLESLPDKVHGEKHSESWRNSRTNMKITGLACFRHLLIWIKGIKFKSRVNPGGEIFRKREEIDDCSFRDNIEVRNRGQFHIDSANSSKRFGSRVVKKQKLLLSSDLSSSRVLHHHTIMVQKPPSMDSLRAWFNRSELGSFLMSLLCQCKAECQSAYCHAKDTNAYFARPRLIRILWHLQLVIWNPFVLFPK